ncbi:dihydrofolate reductase family protein [Rhodocytophaga rosea]|uniref:Dihydrofolate reductase family protein n=1 Tax=Rhodocytophaga rosea TaxID=2704465 RepID=A0A6C0GDL5_9BACT|nr:dihydrofolate reductase family protein [Rhodocytophaga rosea]QHT65914.1 dihydrofolate reductase family protein [Rhodocytophaga rosea]
MKKLKLQMQLTLDGYVAGPNGEMDWMKFNWDEGLIKYLTDLTEPIDCIVLGRKLAEGFIPHWARVAATPDNPEVEAGKKFTNTHKVVFTKTLDQSQWDNTVVAKGNLTEEINALKKQEGKVIMAYGGASFVSSLIRENLIDEYHLFINPVAIGKGLSIFNNLNTKISLQLVHAQSFECGVVVLCYKPEGR